MALWKFNKVWMYDTALTVEADTEHEAFQRVLEEITWDYDVEEVDE